MKRALLLVVFSVLAGLVFGQKEKLPEGKYQGKKDLRDYFNTVYRDYDFNVFSVHIGYQPSNFLNPIFSKSKEEGAIKLRYGYTVGGKVTVFPIVLDCNYFESDFASDDITSFVSDSASIRHRGVEFSLSAVLFPLFHKTNRWIMPNLGIGYQSSQLAILNNTQTISSYDKENLVSSSNTSGAVWRFGILWNLGKTAVISTDYKQGLSLDARKAFHQFSASFGLRLF